MKGEEDQMWFAGVEPGQVGAQYGFVGGKGGADTLEKVEIKSSSESCEVDVVREG